MAGIQRTKVASVLVRNFVFGAEDGLVSTVGLLSGIAIAGVSRTNIILTGIVLVFVEAFSMGIASELSEHSAEEYEQHHEVGEHIPVLGGLVMFISYVVFGFIPLVPYLFAGGVTSLRYSISISLVTLFALGILSAKLSGTKLFRHGIVMTIMGGAAIVIGVAIGSLINIGG
jgi:VIT1/CCC1 family predicted Fe2+/Mn2+ transporter